MAAYAVFIVILLRKDSLHAGIHIAVDHSAALVVKLHPYLIFIKTRGEMILSVSARINSFPLFTPIFVLSKMSFT